MLDNENMEGKNKIDDTILNILKGNIRAEDAIREEQLEKVEKIFDDDAPSDDLINNYSDDDSDDIGLINFDDFGDRSELSGMDSYRSESFENDDFSSGLSSRDDYSESNYGSRGRDNDL